MAQTRADLVRVCIARKVDLDDGARDVGLAHPDEVLVASCSGPGLGEEGVLCVVEPLEPGGELPLGRRRAELRQGKEGQDEERHRRDGGEQGPFGGGHPPVTVLERHGGPTVFLRTETRMGCAMA